MITIKAKGIQLNKILITNNKKTLFNQINNHLKSINLSLSTRIKLKQNFQVTKLNNNSSTSKTLNSDN